MKLRTYRIEGMAMAATSRVRAHGFTAWAPATSGCAKHVFANHQVANLSRQPQEPSL